MKLKDPMHILAVEDNEGDVVLTKKAMEEIDMNIILKVQNDGEQAIDFPNSSGDQEDSALPDPVLLDIILPKKNAHEALHYVKANEKLKYIPVIMLTTSSSKRDINVTYTNHANCLITNPSVVNDFIEAVFAIANFWLNICKLANQKRIAI